MWNVLVTTFFVYVIYLLCGGLLFSVLEAVHQLQIKVVDIYNSTVILDVHDHLSGNYTDTDIVEVVDEWEDFMYAQYFENKTIASKEGWTYSNAFSFAFHLTSTIGYGDISATTQEGQMVTIVYAILGIAIHIIFYRSFGTAFVLNYQEILSRLSTDDKSEAVNTMTTSIYFLVWCVVFFAFPSAIFTFTEDWTFVEGLYYSFITLTTVGLGDYVAGHKLPYTHWHAHLYRVFIFIWMLYGLAFVTMIVDLMTHFYQSNLLFSLNVGRKECHFRRVYVDIEKLDIHFRLLKSEGVSHHFSMWGVRKDTLVAADFQLAHFSQLAALAEHTQSDLMALLSEMDELRFVDALPLKKTE